MDPITANLTNSQTPIVVSANQTALNDRSYTVVANSTFTDPSPVEGKGYRVFVRNGAATINSVAYTENTTIIRLFHSGSWVSYVTTGTNTGNETTSTIGAIVNGASSATPNDTDLVTTVESSVVKKITWTNVKAFLKTYFDTIYTTTSAVASQITTALSGYVVGNAPITAGTYHEVTVDAKGLVTAGSVKWGLLSGNPNSATGATSGTARYFTFGDGTPQNGYTFRQITFVQPTVVRYLYLTTITSQPATGSCVFTVQKNGVDTGIVITVPAGSAPGVFSETATQVSFNAGESITLKSVNNATTTSCVLASNSIGIS
jgi:hypothetical protein